MKHVSKKLNHISINDLQKVIFSSELYYDVPGIKISYLHDTQDFVIFDSVTLGEEVSHTTKDISDMITFTSNIFKHDIFDQSLCVKMILGFVLENVQLSSIYNLSYDIILGCDITSKEYYLLKDNRDSKTYIEKSCDINTIIDLYNIEVDKHNKSMDEGLDFIDRIIFNNSINIENNSVDIFYHETLSKYFGDCDLNRIGNKMVYFNNEIFFVILGGQKLFLSESFQDKLKFNNIIHNSYIIGYLKYYNPDIDIDKMDFNDLTDSYINILISNMKIPELYLK